MLLTKLIDKKISLLRSEKKRHEKRLNDAIQSDIYTQKIIQEQIRKEQQLIRKEQQLKKAEEQLQKKTEKESAAFLERERKKQLKYDDLISELQIKTKDIPYYEKQLETILSLLEGATDRNKPKYLEKYHRISQQLNKTKARIEQIERYLDRPK